MTKKRENTQPEMGIIFQKEKGKKTLPQRTAGNGAAPRGGVHPSAEHKHSYHS
jgi:hypothetical protein